MGWPRKNDVARLYREPDGSYLMLNTADGRGTNGCWEAIANAHPGSNPSLCSCSVSDRYIYEWGLKRVEWSELPPEWQSAFRRWLDSAQELGSPLDLRPERIRGFWRIGNQPDREEGKSLADPGEGSVRYPADREN